MKGILSRLRPSPAMVIACIALGVALGGTSVAAIQALPKNSVGTKQLKKNAVISSKVKNRSLLAVDFKAGQLPQGPKGDPGAPGAPGAPGQQGPPGPGARWAIVNPDGSILRQSGGITTSKPQTGGYLVNFGENVSNRAVLTNSSLNNDGSFRGQVVAASCVDYATYCAGVGVTTPQNTVAVFTTAAGDGAQEDHAFHVAVLLPAAASASGRSEARPATPLGQLGR